MNDRTPEERAARLRSLDNMSEAIALSSPSGRMSKRARKAADERLAKMLWPNGCTREDIMGHGPPQPTKAEAMRSQAARLRDLAARGMKPRAYKKEAERLEAEAAKLDRATEEGLSA